MLHIDTVVHSDYASGVELNKIANSLRKLAYQKDMENRINFLKLAHETAVISDEQFTNCMQHLWADIQRTD